MSKKAVAEKHFYAELNLTDYINNCKILAFIIVILGDTVHNMVIKSACYECIIKNNDKYQKNSFVDKLPLFLCAELKDACIFY